MKRNAKYLELGTRLRQARESARYTQESVSGFLDVSHQMVWTWEAGTIDAPSR